MPLKVEAKYTALRSQAEALALALGLGELPAKSRTIYFFDRRLPDGKLALQSRGLILRARLDEEGLESTVKLRLPNDQPMPGLVDEFTARGLLKVEGDWSGEHHTLSASLTSRGLALADLMEVVAGRKSVSVLLQDPQLEFLTRMADEPLKLEEMVPLGPIPAWTYPSLTTVVQDKLKVEAWWPPEPLSEMLEVSFRCDHDEARELQEQLEKWLVQRGLDPQGQDRPKTGKVLDQFAKTMPVPQIG